MQIYIHTNIYARTQKFIEKYSLHSKASLKMNWLFKSLMHTLFGCRCILQSTISFWNETRKMHFQMAAQWRTLLPRICHTRSLVFFFFLSLCSFTIAVIYDPFKTDDIDKEIARGCVCVLVIKIINILEIRLSHDRFSSCISILCLETNSNQIHSTA